MRMMLPLYFVMLIAKDKKRMIDDDDCIGDEQRICT